MTMVTGAEPRIRHKAGGTGVLFHVMSAPVITAPAPSKRRASRDALGAGPDLLGLYLDEAGSFPLLTKADEMRLGQVIQEGQEAKAVLDDGAKGITSRQRKELRRQVADADAASSEFINANLRLVVSVARKYQWSGLPMGDLIQEGNLGLIHAVEKFDWRKGFKFSTYGTLWIRQAIQRGLQNHGRTIRVPVHVAQRQVKVRKIESELNTRLGREPTDEEIATAAQLTVDEVSELRELGRGLASLDQPVGEDGETALGDLLASERPEPIEEVASSQRDQQVNAVVNQLPADERSVIRLRFGLTGDEPRSLRQTGSELGISLEQARALEEQGLRRLAGSTELESLRTAA